MTDTTFYRKNGFQYCRGLISAKSIETMVHFLESEKQAALELIRQRVGACSESELVGKIKPLLCDPTTDGDLASVLRDPE